MAEPPSSAPLPLSVWPTAQQSAATQRTGRYLPGSTAHPAKMLPAIARQTIAAYSQPGDLILDPMCGIGTTLVEAIHLGRTAIGIELEARWAELAAANIAHAHRHGATGTATVITGDARHLPNLIDPNLAGQVALVLTSPPYGRSIHGQVTARPGRGVAKFDDTYSADPANLGRVNQPTLLKALQQILASCQHLLASDGLLVLTARPYRRREQLVDLPRQLTQIAEAAGLVLYERNAALLAGLRETSWSPAPRSSSWTGSARPAPAGCHCRSSPTKTC
jgi:modification methylase